MRLAKGNNLDKSHDYTSTIINFELRIIGTRVFDNESFRALPLSEPPSLHAITASRPHKDIELRILITTYPITQKATEQRVFAEDAPTLRTRT